jgi:hypothetical protein
MKIRIIAEYTLYPSSEKRSFTAISIKPETKTTALKKGNGTKGLEKKTKKFYEG